jgi:hypothetical protein
MVTLLPAEEGANGDAMLVGVGVNENTFVGANIFR